jgi:hypothetical protein
MMNKSNKMQQRIGQWFDGECTDADKMAQQLRDDPDSTAYLENLKELRAGVKSASERQEIGDPQFPAFMEGIHERLHTAPRRHRGLWALASVTAASLIVALSFFALMTDGQHGDVAADVTDLSTEIPGAEVHYYNSEDGTATVLVDMQERDTPERDL